MGLRECRESAKRAAQEVNSTRMQRGYTAQVQVYEWALNPLSVVCEAKDTPRTRIYIDSSTVISPKHTFG